LSITALKHVLLSRLTFISQILQKIKLSNQTLLIGGALLSVAFILAWIYARERLFADASYYFFLSINQGYPQVDHDRITLLLAQILPLIGLYLGASVKTLVYLHSLGHVLFFGALFVYVHQVKKMYTHALAIAVLSLTGVTVLFFSPMLEIWYGIALAIVWDAALRTTVDFTLWRYIKHTVLVTFILLSHPENFGVVLFVFALYAMDKKLTVNVWIWFVGLVALVFVYKWFTFSEYEAGKINWGLNAEENQFYSDRTSWGYYLRWLSMLLNNYYDSLAMLMIGVIYYIRRGELMRIVIIAGALVGFSFIVHYTNKADEFSRYIESVHMPLVAMSLVVFSHVLSGLNHALVQRLILMLVVLGVSVRVYFITEMGNELTQRVDLIESFVDESLQKGRYKSIVREQDFEGHPGYFKTWSVSIESLILSAMKHPQTPCSIITDDDWLYEQNATTTSPEQLIFRRWEIYDYTWLRHSLFNLPAKPYEWLR
jgi:hypothetical protein